MERSTIPLGTLPKLLVACLCVVSCLSTAAAGDAERHFVAHFIDDCVKLLPNTNAVVARAEARNWRPLQPQLDFGFYSSARDGQLQWAVSHGALGQHTLTLRMASPTSMLSGSFGCTVASQTADPDAVFDEVSAQLTLGKPHSYGHGANWHAETWHDEDATEPFSITRVASPGSPRFVELDVSTWKVSR